MLLHATITGNSPYGHAGSRADSRPPLVILHGLFGNSDNWGTLQRQLDQHFQVIALDLRNHGQSGHDPDINYTLMSDDVIETLAHLQINHYHLLGHSMGGKVAMTLADMHAPGLDKLVLVDIAPREYPPHHQHILDALLQLDITSLRSRTQADKALQPVLPDIAVRLFILKNLVRQTDQNRNKGNSEDRSNMLPQGFRWLFNAEALDANYALLSASPAARRVFTQPVLVLRGAESDYVLDEDTALFAERFSNFELHTIKGAGHWPHASHTTQVIDELLTFLL